MKIIYVIPGSGNTFYCENCIRDTAIVRAMRQAGHEVLVAPMYLPLPGRVGSRIKRHKVFYGAVNLYLKQIFPGFGKSPAWLKKLLDTPFFLKIAAARAGSTRASGLNELTLSMLRGEEGRQADELNQFISWIKSVDKPDVVHLSNALLIGLARRISREAGIPVICSLQDEDTWINDMDKISAVKAWQIISEKARDVFRFIAVSNYYKDFMQGVLKIPADKIAVVYNGIDPLEYRVSPLPFDPPVIGYLSRLSRGLGLDILAEAFIRLQSLPGMESVRLHITGGYTSDDRSYLRRIRRRLSKHHLEHKVLFLKDFSSTGRINFLEKITVLSVPSPQGAAFGLYQLEALASGVPVIQPDSGAFPEVIKATGGGIVYRHNEPGALAQALHRLLSDKKMTRYLGDKGRQAVLDRFTIAAAAAGTVDIYRQSRMHGKIVLQEDQENAV